MKPFFLYPYNIHRESPGELDAAVTAFGEHRVSTNIADIPAGSVVVPRFRALPFSRELQEEIESNGSVLVNSYREHRRIADIFSYAYQLGDLTPACYRLDELHTLPEGEYFLKGETNSLKHSWFTAAYAPTKRDAVNIASRLSQDLVIGSQEIVIRPFQHYRQLTTSIDGRPIFHERRIFTYNGNILSEGFYWSSYADVIGEVAMIDRDQYERTLNAALQITKELCPLVVIDLAEHPDGTWDVIELNDGCMSGLSDNSPDTLWNNFVKQF